MNKKLIWILLFACLLSGGAFFRLWRLTDRPMHTDEAVHAEKFKALLQEGFYAYDPDEFHGPTLNYVTLASAWLRGETTYQQINEATLRIVPAVFGIALILTPLFFLRGLSIRSIVFCSALIAFSPGFIYYSRYYIQEALLIFFTACFLGSAWNYIQSRKLAWVILTGVLIGLMHATKETFVFSLVGAAIALAVCMAIYKQRPFFKVSHLLAAVAAMVIMSALFYSSFGTNPKGIIDSVTTYGIWLQRAGGQSVHVHPWYYYLNLLTWLEFIEPITWNEDGIVAFALIGIGIAFLKIKHQRCKLACFLAAYTLILTAIYSIIPYKTPWCMMSFLYGMVLVAGLTASSLVEDGSGRWARVIFWLILLVYGFVSPIFQSWALNFNFSSHPTNPYVYAHTSDDIYTMIEAVKKAAESSDLDHEIPIQVIAAEGDYWPMPWYLRDYTTVGYWSKVDSSAYRSPVILANAVQEQKLLNMLYSVPQAGQKNLYVPLFDEHLVLRPGVEWRGYIRKDLWDRMNTASNPAGNTQSQKESALVSKPDKAQIENLLKFSHRAMNANFEVFIQDTRGTYAGRAARAAFNEVDRLEGLHSRYIENSDVSRINSLSQGQDTMVDEDTLRCLQIAQQANQLTNGAFDVTIGDIIAAWKNKDTQAAGSLLKNQSSMKLLELDVDTFTVALTGEGVNLDLGGIGKGYAVDVIAQVLKEWGVQKALIHGGASSVRALNPPDGKNGWSVTLTHPIDETVIARLEMADEVLSCSGLQRGEHIINPFTGQAVSDRRACWIRMKENAALADALTTGAMMMPVEKYQVLQETLPDISIMVLMTPEDQSPEILRLGQWPAD